MMICPKCGADQREEKLECVRCGVIFAKLTPEDFDPSCRRLKTPESTIKKSKRPASLIIIAVLLLFGLGYFMYGRLEQKRIDHIGPVAEQPLQENAVGKVIQRGGYEIEPVARYEIRAKVLSVERYRFGREADLSCVDFALGWGPMSDNAIIKQLAISQDNRYYHYSWRGDPPISPALMVRHSANTHLVPADDDVKARLLAVRKGEIVMLKGYLINIRGQDGWKWNSSLTREDSGAGACELMWVVDAAVR
ncbi:MAG: hypothetical protein EG826_16725 [Deltaproteobacteria bacterium]|nr:hypothetical protein [Deltaproteobacteria bacterium]